jgi:hypothetical protein
MNELKKIYRVSIKSEKAAANKKVRDAQRGYDALNDKTSEYAVINKSILDLHIESAKIYNNAPNEITF